MANQRLCDAARSGLVTWRQDPTMRLLSQREMSGTVWGECP